MADLGGLLDAARSKIRGLLGDFPEGFNAGATAGVAGWPGDLAYGIDTARLALTGAQEQAPAQDFPGTTDYIAAKAGHPIPQSLSGQLGAAVGGMLTPGPGDLARLAPLGAMFFGAASRGAKPSILAIADEMRRAGATRDEIWAATAEAGQPWMRYGTNWLYEEPHGNMRVNPQELVPGMGAQGGSMVGQGAKAVDYPQLWDSYPDAHLRTLTVKPSDSPGGGYNELFGRVSLEVPGREYQAMLSDGELLDSRRTLPHEVQHVIANADKSVPQGTWIGDPPSVSDLSPEEWTLFSRAADYHARRGHSENMARARALYDVAYDRYLRNPGEHLARMTSASTDMTAEQIARKPPWQREGWVEEDRLRWGDYDESRLASDGAASASRKNVAPAVTLGDREIPITLNHFDERRGDELVPVWTEAFDAGFQRDDGYIGPQGAGGIGDRYKRFAEFQRDAKSIEAPNVAVNETGKVVFGDGRHRYAFMRDQGAPVVWVAMGPESRANAERLGLVADVTPKRSTK